MVADFACGREARRSQSQTGWVWESGNSMHQALVSETYIKTERCLSYYSFCPKNCRIYNHVIQTLVPSEARLYSGSIDLFRGHGGHGGHGGGHGPPLYPATSLAIAYQTHSEHLPSL